MQASEYQKKVLSTASPMITKDKNSMFLNGALGMCGESGEVADIIKKHTFQGHDLATDKIREEAGDVLWYIAIICEALDITIEELMDDNIRKLSARYPGGFSVDKSVNRKG